MIRIGSRDSNLAILQAKMFAKQIHAKHELVAIKCFGDKSKKAIPKLEEDAFSRELDIALLEGKIDFAVHSLKDLPLELNSKLEICTIFGKNEARDCIATIGKKKLQELKPNAIIGCSTPRRQLELLNLRNDIKTKPVRGTIEERLSLIGKGYDGVIFAKCALDRLKLEQNIAQTFSTNEMAPHAGQGAIAVVKIKNKKFDFIKEGDSFKQWLIEKEFIKRIGKKAVVGACCEKNVKNFSFIGLAYLNGQRNILKLSGDFKNVLIEIGKWKKGFLLD